jgi:L-seryl-tRNA(Ser) seleniumtransferase
MPPDVVAAWSEASKHFVDLNELQDKVGQRIAQLIGVEAAMVTTGAAGAILLGAAGVLTGRDPEKIKRLPRLDGPPREVIIQKAHRTCYENQLTAVGLKVIEVETRKQLERAISERTALLFFLNFAEPGGTIKRPEWLEVARAHKIPTMNDAAADVPPLENLSAYNKMGFDLVAISGGKALGGPNDTGLLLGRNDLIEAAKLNANPHCGTIGRMMKVGKEDMIALLAAVERFVRLDHEAQWREWERRITVIENELKKISTLKCERIVPPVANRVPHLVIDWDEKQVGIDRRRVTKELAEGDPPIQIGRVSGTGDRGILISVLTLQGKEEQIVARRLREIFTRRKPFARN